MYRRTVLTLTALAAVAVTAVATLAPAASAATTTSPTTAQLRQERARVRTHLSEARARARDAAADLAAARELATRLGGGASLEPGAAPAGPPATPAPATGPAPGATPAPLPGAPAAPAGVVPAGMDQVLAARLLEDGAVTPDELTALQERAGATRRQVERWKDKLARLTKRIERREQIARWARTHTWRPLIRIAGEKYGVDPGGLYRMMMLESSGNPRVVGGIYNGLFQYTHSEWARHWNPWRHESIYDGWAQIRATALALSKGMGPGQWPNTYRMAF